ncbi:MAG: SRPBCC domain-containing protein [Anaerolineales bacterium]|nr:MAG: SRPBCC domain-containing protein [Anaerolineales bacterium]
MSNTADREIIATRVFDAPRDTVFAAFTEQQHAEQWWLPPGSTTKEWDAKPGGTWRYSMPTPDGASYGFVITFVEIDKPNRLVYDYGNEGEYAGDPVRTNVTFEDEGGKTKVTLHLVFASAEAYQEAASYGAVGGAKQALESLAKYLGE